jgi:hypothetical protein
MMGKRNVYIILIAETEGKRLPRRLCRDGREILNIIWVKNVDVIFVEPQLVWHRIQWWDGVVTILK